MKNLLLALTVLFFWTAHSQPLEIIRDTLEINIPGDPGPWIKHHNKFYCFFKGYRDLSKTHFYVLSENGEVLSKIPVPPELQTHYYDLHVRNDSILCTEYWDQYTYYLDTNIYQWQEVKKVDDLVYEDDNYYVTSLDYGEWGGCTWFRNKETDKQYEIGVTTPVINKLNGIYYLTSGKTIYRINDPTKLIESDSPYLHNQEVGKRLAKERVRKPSQSLKGATVYFEDTSTWWDSKFYIATSFVIREQLYHLCEDGVEAYIAVIKNGEMEPVYQFADFLSPFRWSYHSRNRILKNRFQTIQFRIKPKRLNGIMGFDGENVTMTYFHNTYAESIMGKSKAEQWFKEIFEFYYSNLSSLSLTEVDSIEKQLDAVNITLDYKMSISIKEHLDLATPRIYRKIEDSILTLNTEYFYTVKEKSVEVIRFEWDENKLYNDNFHLNPDNENPKPLYFQEKFDFLETFLTDRFGKPISSNGSKNWKAISWFFDGCHIRLQSNNEFGNPHEIHKVELTIYKE